MSFVFVNLTLKILPIKKPNKFIKKQKQKKTKQELTESYNDSYT